MVKLLYSNITNFDIDVLLASAAAHELLFNVAKIFNFDAANGQVEISFYENSVSQELIDEIKLLMFNLTGELAGTHA